MSEKRRTEGGLEIVRDLSYVGISDLQHGLETPPINEIGQMSAREALDDGALFRIDEGGDRVLNLFLLVGGSEDRLNVFTGPDSWRSYLSYDIGGGSTLPIVVDDMVRLSLMQVGLTMCFRGAITGEEERLTDEQYARMNARAAKYIAEAELRNLDFDSGVRAILDSPEE
jgi:hypothetical protein